ncbi:polygalacturonase [Bradyrhizobium japonicum]|uniref:glycoside hydrolase family 28 protein n=1 Tax=Bradyrhizobium elkanii TaxID=29448 RepID=UPI00039ABBD8|nr:glycosyl hydrolase family 28 protein [Bradyrhizobium elkanii]MCP1728991.1 polygalacturonase [Bradyrhizobium elkanii]MCS3573119.1 polygalacturonase [Bradyrhizobium elkanii]MCS3594190.1 polygalacturonase [Bradyrhizobium elkanii]MCS3623635.1 polygalacturonase [Bradyrhizobium elkanii]UQD79845.1 polygalacturonase [Bradyrhizobium elkanii USDA 76]
MTKHFREWTLMSIVATMVVCPGAKAQDRRIVAEPVAPHTVCDRPVPSGSNDTARLQDAIDHCPAGAAVYLGRGEFRSHPLEMKSGVTLWIGRGATLLAIPEPVAYDKGRGQCGRIAGKGDGCRPFISFSKTRGGGIYGDGIIDGQGGAPMVGSAETWWQLARRAQAEGGSQNAPRLIQIDHAQDITLSGVTLRNAPNFHVAMNRVEGATVWGLTIDTPADARNTDGIDPGASQDVTIIHSFIRTGDDNVAIKAGDNGSTRHISITDNYFGWGHGMSIGSEVNSGASDILVSNLTLDGTTSGLRIKSDVSRGGLVERVTYENVCLRGNRWPVAFDTKYDPHAQGSRIPVYRQIVLRHVRGDNGALLMRGVDEGHALDVTLEDVRFADSATWQLEHANVTADHSDVSPPLPGQVRKPVPRDWEGCARAFRDGNQ